MWVDRAPVGLSRTAQLEELPNSQSQRGRGNPALSLCSIFPLLFFPSFFFLASVSFSFLSRSLILAGLWCFFDEEWSFSRPFVCSMWPWLPLASRYLKHRRAGWQLHLCVFVIWKCSIAFFIWFSFWMEKQGERSAQHWQGPYHTRPQIDKWFSEGTGNLSLTVCCSVRCSVDCLCSVKDCKE